MTTTTPAPVYSAIQDDVREVLRREANEGLTRREPRQRAPTTLEDLYRLYPDVGTTHVLRVIRKSPRTYGGFQCSGWIEDVSRQLTLSEFQEHFGGGIYAVHVLGPNPDKVEHGGKVQMVSMRGIENMEINGAPKIGKQREEENMSPEQQQRGHPQVEVAKIASSDRLVERLIDTTREAAERGANGNVNLDAIERIARARAEDAERSAATTIGLLKGDNDRLRADLVEKDRRIAELTAENLRVQADAVRAAQHEETRKIAELREQQRDELSRTTQAHISTVEKTNEEHRRIVDEMSRRHAEERRLAEANVKAERDRAHEENERRERQLKDDFDKRERYQREDFQRQQDNDRKQHERELATLRERHESELRTLKMVDDGQLKTSEKAASMTEQTVRQELERVRAENDSYKREVEALRRQVHKPFHEALAEAQSTAAALGMVHASEAGEEGELDWKKALFGLGKAAIEQVGPLIQGVQDVRQRNALATAQAQQAAAMGGMPMMGAPPLPAPSFGPPMPPAWGEVASPTQAPAVPIGPVMAAPPPPRPKPAPIGANIAMPRKRPAPTVQEPTGETMVQAIEPRPPLQPAQQPAAPAAPQQQAPAPQPADNLLAGLTEAQFGELLDTLDQAIALDLATPAEAAKLIVERIGPTQARVLVHSLQPAQIIAVANPSTSLVTPKGKAYIVELWRAVAQLSS